MHYISKIRNQQMTLAQNKEKPFRKRYFFWLDITRDSELHIAEDIALLKRKRLFSKTIRDGIRLIIDLRAGHLNVLFELFPQYKVQFKDTTPNDDDDNGEDIKIALARIEKLVTRQTVHGELTMQKDHANSVIMQAPPQITVKKAVSTGNSAQNFLDAMSMFD